MLVSTPYYPLTNSDISSQPILKNIEKYKMNWNLRKDKAIFLGSRTGPTRNKDNQRIILAEKIRENPEILEGGITQIVYRDEMNIKNLVEFTMEKIPIVKKRTMLEQTKYKYAINVDGHAAAYRNLTLHYLGFLVFKVDSIPERKYIGQLWIDQVLKENVDYIKIDYKMKNLKEKINYYIQNQEESLAIISNVNSKIKNDLSRNGMFDYMSYLFNHF